MFPNYAKFRLPFIEARRYIFFIIFMSLETL